MDTFIKFVLIVIIISLVFLGIFGFSKYFGVTKAELVYRSAIEKFRF